MPSPDVLSQAKAVLTAKSFFVEGGLPASLVGRLAQVKGAKSQSAIVAMFCRAAREYDDGHRPDERTTMDVMLDKVFPNYGSAALLKLLRRFKLPGYLVHDRFSDLFPSAFKNLDAKQDAARLVRLYTAMFDAELDGANADRVHLERSLKRTGKYLPQPVRSKLREALAACQASEAKERLLSDLLAKASPTELATLARELGPRLFTEQYWPASRALTKHLNDLPFSLFEDLARQCVDAKADVYGLAPVIGFLFLRDPAQAAAWVEQAATTDVIAASLSKVIDCVLRWSEQRPHDPDEHQEQLRCSRKASNAMTTARRKLDERDPSRRADALSKEASDLFDKADAKRFGDAVARWAVLAKELDQAHRSRVDNNARRHAVRRLWAKLTTETLAAEVRYGLATPGCDTYGTGDAFAALCLRDFPAAQALVREAGRAAMKDIVDAAIESAQLDADGVNRELAKRPELVEKVKTMPSSP